CIRSGSFAGDRPHRKDRDDAESAPGRAVRSRNAGRTAGEITAMKRWLLAPAILLAGCSARTEQFVMPDQVSDFAALYKTNCSGCHGDDGRMGAARPLNDPLFLAVIGKQKLGEVIANGVPKTLMPAFAKSAGGDLTDQQISILVDQMKARWSRPLGF